MKRRFPTISIKLALYIVVACCALLPMLYVSHYFTNNQISFLHDQKERQLNNTETAVITTIRSDVTRLLDTIALYSSDRFVIQAANNIMFSTPMERKIHDFVDLTDIDAAVYFIDRDWDIAYEAGGNLYQFENSTLISVLKTMQPTLSKGLGLTVTYNEAQLVKTGAGAGVAIIAPLLPFTLEEVSLYEPQGYIVVLLDYSSISARVAPLLLEGESIVFHQQLENVGLDIQHGFSRTLSVSHRLLEQPFEVQVDYYLSNSARTAQLNEYQYQMRRVIGVVLLVTLLVVWAVNRLFNLQFSRISQVVMALSRDEVIGVARPFKFVFTELRDIDRLIKAQRQRIGMQVAELEASNVKLEDANITIAEKNRQLESFNARLEEQVADKTQVLQKTLSRVEKHRKLLDSILSHISRFSHVGYRGLPGLVEQQLKSLFGFERVTFTYQPHERSHVELLSSVDKVQGYLSYYPLILSDEEQLLMDIYCQQLASWVELERITRCDGLTNSFNRLAFDDDFAYLKQQFEKGKEQQLGLIVVDINGLKPINDQYGHELGDKLIIKCSELLHISSAKLMSNIYRVGGDEFVLLLPGITYSELAALEADMSTRQENTVIFDVQGQAHAVSLSIGTVHSCDTDLDDMFQVADDNMYRSKHRHYYQSERKYQSERDNPSGREHQR
ncbi:sensor domain-containing diguanylate cyclase [Vibrio agarivorans]|uniref:sensor domain-containing diguanylate cyclase n=1 Tax=Vibrio agarivorans TaxID=153622 RepID=UPI0022313B8C|nr:diguanylate cyclase [Vibrio agarivorans]